jgi:hypothetical protein
MLEVKLKEKEKIITEFENDINFFKYSSTSDLIHKIPIMEEKINAQNKDIDDYKQINDKQGLQID